MADWGVVEIDQQEDIETARVASDQCLCRPALRALFSPIGWHEHDGHRDRRDDGSLTRQEQLDCDQVPVLTQLRHEQPKFAVMHKVLLI
jgi:hypothetical protein